MKKSNLIKLALVALVFSAISVKAQTAAEVLKKMDDAMYASKDQNVKIKMTLINKGGKEMIREAESMQKGADKRIFRFTSPAAQANIAFLSLPNEVMYIYLPAYKKERRIASHVKNQGFAGTDFSYDDMETKLYSERYNAVSLKTEGDKYVLELTPKEDNKTEYSKLIISLGKSNNYPINVKYFDKTNSLFKELNNSKIEKIGNYWTATEFEMKDLKKGTSTKMEFTKIEFDTNISDDEFTVRKLIR